HLDRAGRTGAPARSDRRATRTGLPGTGRGPVHPVCRPDVAARAPGFLPGGRGAPSRARARDLRPGTPDRDLRDPARARGPGNLDVWKCPASPRILGVRWAL